MNLKIINRTLLTLRIVVASVVFVILGVGLTVPMWMLPGVGPWLESLQIGSAISAVSFTVFVLWLLVTLVFGRIYCSTVCPLGTLQDIFSRLWRMGRFRYRRPYRYAPPANAVRYTMLALTVICIVAGITLLPSVAEPESAFQRICSGFFNSMAKYLAEWLGAHGFTEHLAYPVTVSVASSIVATFLFAVTAVVSALTGRTLCNTICPVGTVLGMVSRYSIFQMDIDTDLCTQCRRCEYVCKAHCINLSDHVVDNSRCVTCFDCVNACRDGAIRYTTDRKRLSQPLMQRIRGLGRREGEASGSATMKAPDNCKSMKKKLLKK